MYKLPPIVANEVKHVSPILHHFGIIYFALSIVLPKCCQYAIVGMSLIETKINVSTDLANARIHGLCKNGDPFHLNSFPHMDVVIFEFFIYLNNKTEDIVKHNSHDPTLKHQQT